jgi:hypothetical protein
VAEITWLNPEQVVFHQAFDNLTPDEVYYDLPHIIAEAA